MESLTDDVEDIEVDVNQVDDRMTVIEETVIGNTNDISGVLCAVANLTKLKPCSKFHKL